MMIDFKSNIFRMCLDWPIITWEMECLFILLRGKRPYYTKLNQSFWIEKKNKRLYKVINKLYFQKLNNVNKPVIGHMIQTEQPK